VYCREPQQHFIKFISECYMFQSYKTSSRNKIRNLKHEYVYIEIFRNLRDITDFYQIYSN